MKSRMKSLSLKSWIVLKNGASTIVEVSGREGEAPAEPDTTAGRRPPEAPRDSPRDSSRDSSRETPSGRQAKVRPRRGTNFALPMATILDRWVLFCVFVAILSTPHVAQAQSANASRGSSALVVLIGGMDSDPTPAQLKHTAKRHEGNSGMYRLMGDLEHPHVVTKYFNWNGTEAGKIQAKPAPGTTAISAAIRDHVQEHPRSRVILVGNSWGGHTTWEVCHELFESPAPIAIDYVVFLDPSSAGRSSGRPPELPININRSTNYYTRNLFGWRNWPLESRLENIDLGDRQHGFLRPGGPAYDSAFNFNAHVAAEWDERVHDDIRKRILSFIPRDKAPRIQLGR